jgi:hypothetical protein
VRGIGWTGIRRFAYPAMALVAVALMAAPASGATLHARQLAQWRRWTRVHSSAVPAFTFASSLFLAAGPREVLINGTRYEMGLTAFSSPGTPSMPPFVSLDLSRGASRGSGVRGIQLHDYSFTPQSGATFTFTRTLATATLDMGSSIAPSQLQATFTAGAPAAKTACRLVTGGHGFLRQAAGTLAYSPFSIVTPTSPFFGTLTTGPVRGQLVFDPGCSGQVMFTPPAAGGGPGAHPCVGRESLGAGTSTQHWQFDKAFQKPRVSQLVFTGTNPRSTAVASESHGVIAVVPGYDLPRATHSPHGATAEVFAARNPFMAGSATFTSATAPRVTGGHSCTARGKTYRFSSSRYTGQLAPNANPLTASFDTGALALTARRATLTIRRYR